MKLSAIHYVDSRSSSRCFAVHEKMDAARESWLVIEKEREGGERIECELFFYPSTRFLFPHLLIFNRGKYE